jgi:hypothetical protein
MVAAPPRRGGPPQGRSRYTGVTYPKLWDKLYTRDVDISDLHRVAGKGKEQDRWVPAAALPRRPRPSSGWVGG